MKQLDLVKERRSFFRASDRLSTYYEPIYDFEYNMLQIGDEIIDLVEDVPDDAVLDASIARLPEQFVLQKWLI